MVLKLNGNVSAHVARSREHILPRGAVYIHNYITPNPLEKNTQKTFEQSYLQDMREYGTLCDSCGPLTVDCAPAWKLHLAYL